MVAEPVTHPVDAACARHPSRGAAGTCTRCGGFFCEHCKGGETRTCASCHAWIQQQALASTGSWAVVATWAIGLHAVAEIIYLATTIWVYWFLRSIGYPRVEAMVTYGTCIGIVKLVIAMSAVLGVFGFLKWQYRATRLAALLGVSHASPRWAVLAWFIPGMNLFKPYLMIRDLGRDLGRTTQWAALVRAWWFTGLFSLMIAAVYRLMRHIDEIVNISNFAMKVAQLLYTGVFLLSATLCIGVIWRIQRRLAHVRNESQLAP